MLIDQERCIRKGIGQGIQYGLYALILTCMSCSDVELESHPGLIDKAKELSGQAVEKAGDLGGDDLIVNTIMRSCIAFTRQGLKVGGGRLLIQT